MACLSCRGVHDKHYCESVFMLSRWRRPGSPRAGNRSAVTDRREDDAARDGPQSTAVSVPLARRILQEEVSHAQYVLVG